MIRKKGGSRIEKLCSNNSNDPSCNIILVHLHNTSQVLYLFSILSTCEQRVHSSINLNHINNRKTNNLMASRAPPPPPTSGGRSSPPPPPTASASGVASSPPTSTQHHMQPTPASSSTTTRRGELDDDLAEVELSAELDVC